MLIMIAAFSLAKAATKGNAQSLLSVPPSKIVLVSTAFPVTYERRI